MMSEANGISGGLYLVPSPLGNLGDLTFRAAEVLKAADLVAAEDTRRALKLLNHLNVRVSIISYREQNHRAAWPKIADILAAGGRVALLTDAGAPGVSDPGAALAAEARGAGFAIIPLPGPSAVVTALMASGFSADRFTFAGFIPARTTERRNFLLRLKEHPWTLVFFETPHRLAGSLADMAEIFGPRPALLAREMTKIHEEYFAGDLITLAADVSARPRRGEMTIAVEGQTAPQEAPPLDVERVRRLAQTDGRPTRALAAALAEESGRGRSELYQLILAARQGE